MHKNMRKNAFTGQFNSNLKRSVRFLARELMNPHNRLNLHIQFESINPKISPTQQVKSRYLARLIALPSNVFLPNGIAVFRSKCFLNVKFLNKRFSLS